MGRRGRPGLLGTVGRTAVIAGTATATANAVNRRAHDRAAAAAPPPGAAPPAAAPPAAAPPAPPPSPAAAPVAPPPVAVPAPPVAADGDLVNALSRLAQLRDAGALTETEFQAAKSRLLGV